MIRTIVIAAIIATFSINANASDSSHCNLLDKGMSVNKQELSDFDKCWLDTHRSEEISGTHLGIFYAKVPNIGYVSVPVGELFKQGRDGGEALFYAKAELQALEITEQQLKQQRNELIASLEHIRSQISKLQTTILLVGGDDQLISELITLHDLEQELVNTLF